MAGTVGSSGKTTWIQTSKKEIAKAIIGKKSDYILAFKGNQGSLKEEVGHIFSRQNPYSKDTAIEKGLGRIKIRQCQVITNITFLDEKKQWINLASLIKADSKREANGEIITETRLYISSINDSANFFNTYIRQHWGIENSLHWTLDVTFNEDQQRKRDGLAAQIFALVQKNALNLLRSEKSKT